MNKYTDDDCISFPIIVDHDPKQPAIGWAKIRKDALAPYMQNATEEDLKAIIFAPAFIINERKDDVITKAELIELSLITKPSQESG